MLVNKYYLHLVHFCATVYWEAMHLPDLSVGFLPSPDAALCTSVWAKAGSLNILPAQQACSFHCTASFGVNRVQLATFKLYILWYFLKSLYSYTTSNFLTCVFSSIMVALRHSAKLDYCTLLMLQR